GLPRSPSLGGRRHRVGGARRRVAAAGRAARERAGAQGHGGPRGEPAGSVPRADRPALRRGTSARRGRESAGSAAGDDEVARPPRRQCPARGPDGLATDTRGGEPLAAEGRGTQRLAQRRSKTVKTMKDGLRIARALRGLGGAEAPATLLPDVMRRIGLGDAYWKLESPVGPV